MRHLTLAIVCTILVLPAAAETYVVPLWARALPASDGEWWTQATIVNPRSFPVVVTVTGVFPLATTPCSTCTATTPPMTIAPLSSIVLAPPSGRDGQALVAGAVEVTTSAPVQIPLVAYRAGANEIRQRLDVARTWLTPGRHAISAVERGGPGWRINVFIVNPSATPLTASVWALNRAENERRITIPPQSTAVVGLPTTLCGGPCSFPDTYPPPPLRVEVEAHGPFLASVSAVTPDWAVFSLADDAH